VISDHLLDCEHSLLRKNLPGKKILPVFSFLRSIMLDKLKSSGKLVFDYGNGRAMTMRSRVWKDGTRRAIAYVEGREVAETLKETLGKVQEEVRKVSKEEALTKAAMAVYLDKKGKPFAWQFAFDVALWERVSAVVGAGAVVS
jgi:hypothetical protein